MSDTVPGLGNNGPEITDLLLELRSGSREAESRLYALIYADLRGLAHAQLRREREGHTLGTTGLVHETYLRLVDQTRVEWRDRAHFFGAAALAMRRILVDYARLLPAGAPLERCPGAPREPAAAVQSARGQRVRSCPPPGIGPPGRR